MTLNSNVFDDHYFKHWYRNSTHRVSTLVSATRKAKLSLATAEYYLDRPVRTVLDVGCGEGQWQPILKKINSKIHYTGVDPSSYAIAKFGKKRNLTQGSFAELQKLPLRKSYDLIVCSDILYYITERDLKRGLRFISKHLNGVAFLEAYSSDEELEGDTKGMISRSVQDYQRLFQQFGFISCGSHCYLTNALSHRITPLERGAA